ALVAAEVSAAHLSKICAARLFAHSLILFAGLAAVRLGHRLWPLSLDQGHRVAHPHADRDDYVRAAADDSGVPTLVASDCSRYSGTPQVIAQLTSGRRARSARRSAVNPADSSLPPTPIQHPNFGYLCSFGR